jgi:hypothetical protein
MLIIVCYGSVFPQFLALNVMVVTVPLPVAPILRRHYCLLDLQ